MAEIKWNKTGERIFEAGVDRGVLYPKVGSGVPWNGLVSINETPTGGEAVPHYLDGVKFYNKPGSTEFHATLEAFTYPDKFDELNGSPVSNGLSFEEQNREEFGLTYRTLIGDDVVGLNRGYKIHMVYNALASPTASANVTKGAVLDPNNFTWDITATPEIVDGRKPTAHFTFDTTKTKGFRIEELERILYGTSTTSPRLPTPKELIDISKYGEALRIVPRASGIAAITYGSIYADLYGDVDRGIYKKHAQSRLRPTSVPGFSTLEV